MSTESQPSWALPILHAPGSDEPVHLEGNSLLLAGGKEVGRLETGVFRFPVREGDDSIGFYRKVGGAHFHERRAVPFAMSSLDTQIYHSYLEEVRPPDLDGVVVDVGGGDGRNALP